ncbi:MAG: hypothetical protein ACFHX7_17555 [Pseudomonadota bacterium]
MKAWLTEHAPLLILAIGVSLAAAGGARLGKADFESAVTLGQARMMETEPGPHDAVGSVDSATRLAEWSDENLGLFGTGILLVVVGAVLTRRRHGSQRRAASEAHASVNLSRQLDALVQQVEVIRNRLDQADADPLAVRSAIEDLQLNLLDPLFASRDAIELQFGLSGYAAIMGPLAGTERFMNRTWTTLVDHHRGEARASIALALASATAAREAAANLT